VFYIFVCHNLPDVCEVLEQLVTPCDELIQISIHFCGFYVITGTFGSVISNSFVSIYCTPDITI
jgi:hypothetical protein